MPRRDVMSLIKNPAPLLSMEAYEEEDHPLGGIIEAAARDESCVWHRVGASLMHVPLHSSREACLTAPVAEDAFTDNGSPHIASVMIRLQITECRSGDYTPTILN
jgi:hypothetical protein